MLVCFLPPLMLLVLIGAASLAFGLGATASPADIEEHVIASTSILLLLLQLAMLLLLVDRMRREGLRPRDLGWTMPKGGRLGADLALGAGVGIALGITYAYAIAPLLTWLQSGIGDYVPAGEILPALRRAPVAFFLANVVFAPAVEESFYRGYALRRLARRFAPPVAGVWSCAAFGALHWPGGLWYVLLTGGLVGGLLTWVRLARGSLIGPFAAHLALNLVEWAYA